MPALSVQNLSMSYGNDKVVDAVSFEVEFGDYLCIVGENGAGKTTLLRGMIGIQPCKSGKVVFDKSLSQSQIGYLPQQTAVQKDFPASVWEVVLSGCVSSLGLKPFYTKKEKELALANMRKLNITNLRKSSYQDLSGGQQQRVLLAKALCGAQKLLFLDEPVTGLDPVVTHELYALIKQLNKTDGLTVVMVSHDVANAISFAGKILHLDKEILFYGRTSDYIASDVGKRFLQRLR